MNSLDILICMLGIFLWITWELLEYWLILSESVRAGREIKLKANPAKLVQNVKSGRFGQY